MPQFKDRERGFEAKFAHDEEMKFRAQSRRNKLLGLWAAELMGLGSAEAESYAREVIKADFEEAGDEDVFRKLRGDLDAKNVQVSDQEIRSQIEKKLAEAKAQLLEESETREE